MKVLMLMTLLLLSTTTLAKDNPLLVTLISKYEKTYKHEIAAAIKSASERHKIDPLLITSIIKVESKFNPKAYNKGCVGLMQINTKIWKVKRPNNLYNIRDNVMLGTKIFAKYYQKTKCIKKALIRYSGGSEVYAKKVLSYYYKIGGTYARAS